MAARRPGHGALSRVQHSSVGLGSLPIRFEDSLPSLRLGWTLYIIRSTHFELIYWTWIWILDNVVIGTHLMLLKKWLFNRGKKMHQSLLTSKFENELSILLSDFNQFIQSCRYSIFHFFKLLQIKIYLFSSYLTYRLHSQSLFKHRLNWILRNNRCISLRRFLLRKVQKRIHEEC